MLGRFREQCFSELNGVMRLRAPIGSERIELLQSLNKEIFETRRATECKANATDFRTL